MSSRRGRGPLHTCCKCTRKYRNVKVSERRVIQQVGHDWICWHCIPDVPELAQLTLFKETV